MKLSYVIPLYNREPIVNTTFTKKAIESIKKFTQLEYEIILIDNRSPDHEGNTMHELREELYQDAKVIALNENIGFGAACNLGFRLAQGEYVCCMNSDSELVEDSCSILIDFMERLDIKVAFPESYEGCMHYKMEKDNRVMTNWFFGAFWISKREFIYEKFGGFDSVNFPMCYHEDFDAWSRIIQAGYRIAGYRGTWVKHHGNASSLPNINELVLKNRETYFKKWGTYGVIERGSNAVISEKVLW